MQVTLRFCAFVVLSIVVVGCSQPGSPGSPGPSTSPSTAITHATGPADILLRYDEGGGFVPIEFFANHVPIFTMYGDGTVLYVDPATDPLPVVDGVTVNRPLRAARLTEEQVQATLRMAISEGGLATAQDDYRNDQVADASTATFVVNAGDLHRTISVYALGLEIPGGKDAEARAGFKRLAGRLRDFGQAGIAPSPYVPARYRGVLMNGSAAPVAAPKPWPWPELKPADFAVPADRNGYALPSRTLTVDQVKALGFESPIGGLQGLALAGPGDGKVYAFTLRPLLPDEDRPSIPPPAASAGPPDTPRPTTEPSSAPSPIQSAEHRFAPIEGLTVGEGGRHLSIAFVGGRPYAADDPCSIEYAATTRVVDGVLEVGVFDSRRPPVPVPVCDAIGYERHLEVDLATPFTGTTWRDLFDGSIHAL